MQFVAPVLAKRAQTRVRFGFTPKVQQKTPFVRSTVVQNRDRLDQNICYQFASNTFVPIKNHCHEKEFTAQSREPSKAP